MAGVLKKGMDTPAIAIAPRYSQKLDRMPNSRVMRPNSRDARVIVCTRLRNPPQAARMPPPAIMPTEKAISIAIRCHSPPPKLRTTCNGVRKEAGAARNRNRATKRKNRFR